MTLRGEICLVVALPPPTVGMAVLNQSVCDLLLTHGHKPLVVDVAAPNLARHWLQRFRRLGRVLQQFRRYAGLLPRGAIGTVYLSLSGGVGQVYDLVFLFLARAFGIPIFIHHHSYAYLSVRRPLTAVVIWTAGTAATHFVGCEDQGRRLRSLYRAVTRVASLPNAALLARDLVNASSEPRRSLSTIGFLGNISVDKGILEFLDVAARVQEFGLPLNLLIAGPFSTGKARRAVLAGIAQLPNVQYVGPKYGGDKAAFLRSIDVLLFPTRYSDETSPVTIYEALSNHIPVIAWERGCIASMLADSKSLCIPRDHDYVAAAVQQLRRWTQHPTSFHEASVDARTHCLRAVSREQKELDQAMTLLVEATCPLHPPGDRKRGRSP